MNETNIFKTKQGLTVIHNQTSEKDVFAVSVMCTVGSLHENDSEIGVAHLLEHVVMDETKKYPGKGDVHLAIENSGGRMNARTSMYYIEFKALVIKENVEIAFDALSQVFIDPLLTEERTAKEKQIVIQEIRQSKNNFGRCAYEMSLESTFLNNRHGLPNMGTEESVAGLTSKILSKFHKKHFNKSNTVISVSGDILKENLLTLVDKYFGLMPEGEASKIQEPIINKDKEILVENKNNLTQAHINILFPIRDSFEKKNYFANWFVRLILSEGKQSKLFKSIRTDRGFAYTISSYLMRSASVGNFHIYTAVDELKANEAIGAILDEINLLKTSGITDQELERAKNLAISQIIFSSENAYNRVSNNAITFLFRKETQISDKKDIEFIKSLTKEDINTAIKNIFTDDYKLSVLSKSISKEDIEF